MVGFLNCSGGIIYLGVKEEESRLRRAVGLRLSERAKEELLFSVRQIAELIEPDIVMAKLYKVTFVPMRNRGTNAIIAGKFIVKIIV
jgi:hypothetical protein